MTGTNFLNTPDGRGRSPWQKNIDGIQSAYDTFTVESHFTATQLHNLWPEASLHTQWPGNGSLGDPIFNAFYASTVPSLDSDAETATKIREAGSALLDKIGSGQHGWVLGDARPTKVKAIVALEPIGPPFINAVFPPFTAARDFGVTDIPITYSPPVKAPDDIAK
ncbi:hypothetical protein C0992_005567, partial [Termitomyces sp. T32_za158]